MKTDIQEDEHVYTLDIDLPGYNKEDIKIDVTNEYLTISAKTNHEEKDEKSNYVRRERFIGECSRSFYVGEDIKVDEIPEVVINIARLCDVDVKNNDMNNDFNKESLEATVSSLEHELANI